MAIEECNWFCEGVWRVTEDQLGRILRDMYDNAARGEKVAHIHLFGIRYASEISNAGLTPKGVVRSSGIKESYAAEVSKGMNLAKYVAPKPV